MDAKATAKDLVSALGRKAATAYVQDQVIAAKTLKAREEWNTVAFALGDDQATWNKPSRGKAPAKKMAAKHKVAAKSKVRAYDAHGKPMKSFDPKARAKELGLSVGDTIDGYGGANSQSRIHSFSVHGVHLVKTKMFGGAVRPSKTPDLGMTWEEAREHRERFHKRGARSQNPTQSPAATQADRENLLEDIYSLSSDYINGGATYAHPYLHLIAREAGVGPDFVELLRFGADPENSESDDRHIFHEMQEQVLNASTPQIMGYAKARRREIHAHGPIPPEEARRHRIEAVRELREERRARR